MYETANFESQDTVETDYPTDLHDDAHKTPDSESGSSSDESKKETQDKDVEKSADKPTNPEWDDSALYNLVSENQDVLVKDGDTVKTVSEFILSHPGPWTAENEPNLIAYVHQLLANRVAETETEDKQEDTIEKEKPTDAVEDDKKDEPKAEVKEAQVNPVADDSKKQPEKTGDNTEKTEIPVNQTEKPAQPLSSTTPKAETQAIIDMSQSEPSKPAPNTGKAKVAAGTSKDSAKAASAENSDAIDASPAESSTNSESLAQAPAMGRIDSMPNPTPASYRAEPEPAITSKAEVKQPALAFEPADAPTEAAPAAAAETIVDDSGISEVQESGIFIMPEAIEDAEVHEPFEPHDLEFEDVVLDDVETPDFGDASTEDESLVGFDDFTELIEEEVLMLDHAEENLVSETFDIESVDVEEDIMAIEIEGESETIDQVEIIEPGQVVEIDLSAENVADPVAESDESVENIEPEAPELIVKDIEEVEQVVVKSEADNTEIIIEPEVQKELEEQVTELLDGIDIVIEYPPELVEALINLANKWYVADQAQKLKIEREIGELVQDPGTREAIINVLVGLNDEHEPLELIEAIGGYALAHSFELVA